MVITWGLSGHIVADYRGRLGQRRVFQQYSKNMHHPNHLRKTVVFERRRPTRKISDKSGLNLSQNTFLISTSRKARMRLSFERVHDDQTDKGRSPSRAGEAATAAGRLEGRASAIIRCRRHHVETDADRLCPR